MKKTISSIIIISLFACPLILSGQESKPKPDYLFWTLAAANLTAGAIDTYYALSSKKFLAGKIAEANPVAKYILENCLWALPVYMIGTTAAIVGGCYLMNKLGFKPFGHFYLGGTLLARGYMIYLVIKFPY